MPKSPWTLSFERFASCVSLPDGNMSPTTIVAYLALFTAVAIVFLFVHLTIGRLLRPKAPNEEKLAIYECGEPTIGSSFVQFDLRFYVVALLFIIFDVEVAFFFPWATVFGKATHLMNPAVNAQSAGGADGALNPVRDLHRELGVPIDDPSIAAEQAFIVEDAGLLARMSFADILVFFAVLLVGFAYVWKRGDLDWVRALSRERARQGTRGPPSDQPEEEPALVG